MWMSGKKNMAELTQINMLFIPNSTDRKLPLFNIKTPTISYHTCKTLTHHSRWPRSEHRVSKGHALFPCVTGRGVMFTTVKIKSTTYQKGDSASPLNSNCDWKHEHTAIALISFHLWYFLSSTTDDEFIEKWRLPKRWRSGLQEELM